MGKNKDKKKKGLGAEKTAAKMAKKEEKNKRKAKGEGGDTDGGTEGEAGGDEEDIDALLAKCSLQNIDKTLITPCDQPSARWHATLLPHPTADKLVLLGGEYYDGRSHETYGELQMYDIKKASWSLCRFPTAPFPRSSHQAVMLPRMGGQMWVFGGEYTSPKGIHRHYGDLWMLSMESMEWTQHKLKHGPSPRSGCRLLHHKNKLFVFGGFKDQTTSMQYLNDLFVLDLDTMEWTETKPEAHAHWPPTRAGHLFVANAANDTALLFGGVHQEKKREDLVTVAHTDAWKLDLNTLTWQQVKPKGDGVPAHKHTHTHTHTHSHTHTHTHT
jgi:hypothetical protein